VLSKILIQARGCSGLLLEGETGWRDRVCRLLHSSWSKTKVLSRPQTLTKGGPRVCQVRVCASPLPRWRLKGWRQ
jgi:hypothetical protein